MVWKNFYLHENEADLDVFNSKKGGTKESVSDKK